MRLMFSKYQGAGNDFVLIYDRPCLFPVNDHDLISRLCDRRFGVGADGLMLLRPSAKYDFRMIYFNSDGYEGTMCGNGGRCIVVFAEDMGLVRREDKIIFEAVDGKHEALFEDDLVALKMIDVPDIKTLAGGYYLDTGSEHFVQFRQDKEYDFISMARSLRHDPVFAPLGVNVNIARDLGEGVYENRTFERGVEDETLACGTGSVAVAVCAGAFRGAVSPVLIKMPGGDLEVSFDKKDGKYENVWLKGPAEFVFQGQVEV